MAPPLELDNAGLLRLIWSNGGSEFAVNVYAFMGTATTPPTGPITATLATAISGAYTTAGLSTYQPPTIALTRIGLRSINDPNLAEFTAAVTGAVGASASPLMPLQVALCVTLRTAFAGRRFRGRSYLPGFATNANTATSTISGGASGAAQLFVNSVDSALQASGYNMAVLSRPIWTETPPDSGLFVLTRAGIINDVVTAEIVDQRWDTQRRRLDPGI